jgi:hypothetical protein
LQYISAPRRSCRGAKFFSAVVAAHRKIFAAAVAARAKFIAAVVAAQAEKFSAVVAAQKIFLPGAQERIGSNKDPTFFWWKQLD